LSDTAQDEFMSTNVRSRQLFTELKEGDRVEVVHEVKVGSSKTWLTKTVGTVVNTERRRQGLHFRRNPDDKVFADLIVLKRDDGELTTVSMDEFTELRRVS
jgi:(p)ppGpp synthase/HD superfamily hydrolase